MVFFDALECDKISEKMHLMVKLRSQFNDNGSHFSDCTDCTLVARGKEANKIRTMMEESHLGVIDK